MEELKNQPATGQITNLLSTLTSTATINGATLEMLNYFKENLPLLGLKDLEIAYTELNEESIWIFKYEGDPSILEEFLQDEAENQGYFSSIKIIENTYYSTFIIG